MKVVNFVIDHLDSDNIIQLIEIIQSEFTEERLTDIIIKLNRANRLGELLELLEIEEVTFSNGDYQSGLLKTAKIVVFGETKLKPNILTAIGEQLGINKNRFELHLNYHDAKTFNFQKYQYNSNYSLILVGPMGHSGKSKGKESSVITHIINEDGFPPVVRLISNGQLKITKTNFRKTLQDQLNKGTIIAA